MLQAGKGHERAMQVAMRLTTQLGLNEKERLGKLFRGSDRSNRGGESGKDVLGKGTVMSKDTAAWNSVIIWGTAKRCSDSQKDACGRVREDKFGEIDRGQIEMTLPHFIRH